jgi:hypothetical protein
MGFCVWNCLLDGIHASFFAKITEFYKIQRFGTGSIYMYVCMYAFIHACMHVCIHVCMHVCIYVCIIYLFIHFY